MKLATLLCMVLFVITAIGFNVLPTVPTAKQVKKTPKAVQEGMRVYEAKCKICHEATEIDMSRKTYTQMMPLLISMVDMEKLSRKEIDRVAAYVYSVSAK